MKKTYWGFAAWLIGYTLVMLALSLIPMGVEGYVRILCAETVLAMVLLTYIVYRTEYVYWYNGVSFEEAVQAGSQRRRAYALAHLKRFAVGGAAYLLYGVIAWALGLPWWLDLLACLAAEVGAAVSTIPIKL